MSPKKDNHGDMLGLITGGLDEKDIFPGLQDLKCHIPA